MAHWEGLRVKDEIHIMGRGMILTVNVEDDRLMDGMWIPVKSPISVGDSLIYENKEYVITGVEGFRNLLNGRASHMVGLIVNSRNEKMDKT